VTRAAPEITAPVHGTVITDAIFAEQQQHASPSGAWQPSLAGTLASAALFVRVIARGRMPVASFRVCGTVGKEPSPPRAA
jgi:hypothetical protein